MIYNMNEFLKKLTRAPRRYNDVICSRKVKDVDGIVFPEYDIIKYTRYMNTAYDDNLHTRDEGSVPVLSMDIPYDYYSMTKVPSIEELGADAVLEKYKEICENGITDQLFMEVHSGRIVSSDTNGYIVLTVANLLKLPSIPVNFYMTKNDINVAEASLVRRFKHDGEQVFKFEVLSDKLRERLASPDYDYITFADVDKLENGTVIDLYKNMSNTLEVSTNHRNTSMDVIDYEELSRKELERVKGEFVASIMEVVNSFVSNN